VATRAPSVTDSSGADAALFALGRIAVKGRAPMTDFAPAMFGSPWTDDVPGVAGGGNGCDTRDDILRRDLDGAVTDQGGCAVVAGVLHDPYSGATVDFTASDPDAVQIDHVVSLADAWATGIQYKSVLARVQLANDPLNLQATTAAAQAGKSDADAATWLPSNVAYRCTYVTRQIEVKAKYQLWITTGEQAAMVRTLQACEGTPAPSTQATPVTTHPAATTTVRAPTSARPPSTTSRPPATTQRSTTRSNTPKPPSSVAPKPPPPTTAAAQPQGCHPLSKAGNCYRPGQFCRASDHGVTGIDAFGERIQCLNNNGWRWERI
jgi:hypothetical protein